MVGWMFWSRANDRTALENEVHAMRGFAEHMKTQREFWREKYNSAIAERDALDQRQHETLARAVRAEKEVAFLRAMVFRVGVGRFHIGDRLRKVKGSEWVGRVVGWYSTPLTPIGYAIESEAHAGSVQIYPETALEPVPQGGEHDR